MLTIERPNANLQKGFSEYAGRSMDCPVAVLPRRDSPTVDGTGAKEHRYPGPEARHEVDEEVSCQGGDTTGDVVGAGVL
jgi:hypothetical protein